MPLLGPVSEFTIEQLSDLTWVHSYIPGPDNSLFDALSRYLLLGPRVLAPVGLSDAVSHLLDHLPDSLKNAPKMRVFFAPPHTQKVAQQLQAWRRPTNPIDIHSITHRTSPPPDTGFILTMPRAEDAPHIAARLLTTTIPFAVLLPSDLAPRVADPNQFDGQPDLHAAYQTAGKIMFLDSDHLWLVSNIPPCTSSPASTLKSCNAPPLYSRPTPPISTPTCRPPSKNGNTPKTTSPLSSSFSIPPLSPHATA
jgi:hypothetical protein